MLLSALQGAVAGSLGEEEFRGAAIYNILQFVQWPEGALPPDGMMRLCQLGAGAVSPELAQLAGRMVHKRKLLVRRIDGGAEDLALCDAIWVNIERIESLGRLAAARQRPVLLLGEGPEATDRGAMVGLWLDKGRARLRVDNVLAREAGLLINARLVRMANGMNGQP